MSIKPMSSSIVTASTTPSVIMRPAMIQDAAGIGPGVNSIGTVNVCRQVLITNASATIGASFNVGSSTTLVTPTATVGVLVPPMGYVMVDLNPDDDRLSIRAISTTAIVGVIWCSSSDGASG